MTPKSAKAKGRRLQQDLRNLLIEVFNLDPELVKCAIMGEKGVDVMVLGTALPDPLHVAWECKAVESFSLYGCWTQTVANAQETGRRPILVTRRNNSTAMAVLPLEDLVTLIYLARKGEQWKLQSLTHC